MDHTVFIILPVHNRSRLTASFVNYLLAQSDQNYHLLLVNDGCTDDTVEVVRQRTPEVTVIDGDGNLWWAASVQKGIDWLVKHDIEESAIVLIANDDTSFDAEFLAAAREFLTAHSNVMLQAVPVDPATGSAIDHGTGIDWRRFRMYPVVQGGSIDCLSSRCLFSRLGDLINTGGFRPRLLPHYFSDYEFTIRAKRRGIRLATAEHVRIFMSPATTGVLSTRSLGLGEFMRVAFSKRHSYNPLYFSNFVLLTAPLRHVPLSLLRVWSLFVLALVRAARVSLADLRRKIPGQE